MNAQETAPEASYNYPPHPKHTLAILQDVQKRFGYVSREQLRGVSDYLRVPLADVYALVTFFKAFRLTPRGRHTIKVCDGTACHIKGSVNLLEALRRELGVSPGETTGDMLFSLETVNCIGACAIAPAMMVDGVYYGKVTAKSLTEILASYGHKPGRSGEAGANGQ